MLYKVPLMQMEIFYSPLQFSRNSSQFVILCYFAQGKNANAQQLHRQLCEDKSDYKKFKWYSSILGAIIYLWGVSKEETCLMGK